MTRIIAFSDTHGGSNVSVMPDEVWYDGYLEMVRRCDAVLLVPGWERSKGALMEKDEADRHGIRVFEYDQVGIPSPDEAIR